mgnify:CR=1 FL=1
MGRNVEGTRLPRRMDVAKAKKKAKAAKAKAKPAGKGRGRPGQKVKEFGDLSVAQVVQGLRAVGYFPKTIYQALTRAGYTVALATVYQAAAKAAGGAIAARSGPAPKLDAGAVEAFMSGLPLGRGKGGGGKKGDKKKQKPKKNKK